VKDAEAKVEKLQEERDALEEKVQTLEEEQPEAAEIRGEFEEKLKRKQEQLNQAQEKIEEVRQKGQEALRSERQQMFTERTKAHLLANGADDFVARSITRDAIQSDRVQFDDDLNPVVYEPGGETPTPLGEQDAHEALASSLLDEIPDEYIDDGKPGRTGIGSTNGAAGDDTMKRAQFDDLSPAKQKQFVDDGGEVVD